MKIAECNPYVRTAQIQPAVLEGTALRMAYDNRLFYVLDNTGAVIIDNVRHDVTADTLIFIPPETGYCFKGKLRVAVLNFDMTRSHSHKSAPICPPAVNAYDRALRFDMTLTDGFEKPIICKGDLVLRNTVLQLVNEFSAQDGFCDALTSATLKTLLINILQECCEKPSGDALLIRKVYGYIRSNVAAIHDNVTLAEEFGYHPVYLGEVFKKVTGMTLHDAISDERIKLSCRWLTQTDKTVEEIALSVGFCSRSHFCTAFKSKMGQTPSEYRKKQSNL